MTVHDSPTGFSPAAHWIWGASDPAPRNIWRYFRRNFSAPADLERAMLLITADTRYECTLNGVHLGRGPARGFPFAYSYDTYDVTAALRRGATNTIAALVNFLNDHTMSYIRGRGGLLAEVVMERTDGSTIRIGSNGDWLTQPCPAFSADAPRVSLQLDFEEQYDARQEIADWQSPAFDDSAWEKAVEIGPVGCAPWTALVPRAIPFLSEDPVAPIAIRAAELARPAPGIMWHLDVREPARSMRTGFRTAPPGERGWIIFTELFAPRDCAITVHTYASYERIDLRVNDDLMTPIGERAPVRLKQGANLVMLRNTEYPTIFFETDEPITLSAERFAPGAAWVFSGPFDERGNELERRWTVKTLDDLPADDPRVGIPPEANRLDVALLTMSQHFYAVEGGFCAHEITRAQPRPHLEEMRPNFIDRPDALLHDNAAWTVLHPQADGDTHLVIDFGRELIGYLRLDIDAPAGAIIDASFFEGIDDTGIFWMRGTRNSLRYTCREGQQTFTSHARRGYRYVSLTFRNFARPIRIRCVDMLFSTYPVEARGRFHCSDETLNRIWEVAAHTARLCMLDTYVDCPAYEQVYWVGDARNTALTNAMAFGAFDLTEHCVRLAGQSLRDELALVKAPFLTRPHLVTSHVVSGWFDEIPMWTFLWVAMAWEQYGHTGDRSALADFYTDVRECLRRCEGFLTARDLLDVPDVWNLLDWSANDLERSGEVIANTALMARALDQAAAMARELGRPPDEIDVHTALAARLRQAINAYGWSEEHRAYVDTVRDAYAYEHRQAATGIGAGIWPPLVEADTLEAFQSRQRISEQTNTLALLCGCVPPERRDDVLRLVLNARAGRFESSSPEWARFGSPDEIVPVGSPWFLFFTLETLFQEGYAADALNLIREQWNRMLEKGATTFWETFPGRIGSGHSGEHWSRSLCHGWSSGPAYFLSRYVLGVTPTAPGYRRVKIAPRTFGLTHAAGDVPTPLGTITVSWSLDSAGRMQIEYGVPAGCVVEFVGPAEG